MIDRDCLRMWREKPFLGWGLGTFPIVYPQFRSFYTTFFVNQAHNDYLQLLSELGVPGFLLIAVLTGGVALQTVRVLGRAADPQTRWGMQSLILDVLRKLDNTVLFVTHDISEAVFLADVVFVLSHRPAKVLHRVEIPYFESRDPALKQSAEFKKVEDHLLELLQSLQVKGNMRVSL